MKKIVLLLYLFLPLLLAAQAPIFEWAKSIGGSGNDFGYGITTDQSGNVYTTGYFQGISDFDPGSEDYNLTSVGSRDIFVSKLDPNGQFLWAHSFGSDNIDIGYGITTDDENVYVTGRFRGLVDFDPGPATYNLTSSGNDDIFILKLTLDGAFIWARRMGGSRGDRGRAIEVDQSGNVYTTGSYRDTADFDPGVEIFNLETNFFENVFVSKLDSNGNFLWAKSLGGIQGDNCYTLALDNYNNVYTSGYFSGNFADFDPGPNLFSMSSIGYQDMFVSKLDTNGEFVWAKQIGGNEGLLDVFGMVADDDGNLYITGVFRGDLIDFDPGVAIYNLAAPDTFLETAFISKLDTDGDFLWASSFYVGSGYNWYSYRGGIALDENNQVYITANLSEGVSFNLPPYSIIVGSNIDSYLLKFDEEGNYTWIGLTAKNLLISSGHSITIDKWNNIYSTGAYYDSADFDPSTDIYQISPLNAHDVYIHKLSQCGAKPSISSPNDSYAICPGDSIILNVEMPNSPSTVSYSWSSGENTNSITVAPDSSSLYVVTANYAPGCTSSDTVEIMVYGPMEVALSEDIVTCASEFISLEANGGTNYLWNTGDTTNSIVFSAEESQNYHLTITDDNGCISTDSVFVSVLSLPNPELVQGHEICLGDSVMLYTATSGSYLWSDNRSENTITVAPLLDTEYFITLTDVNGCIGYDSTWVLVNSLPVATISENMEICIEDEIDISVSGDGTYIWSTEDTAERIYVTPLLDTEYTVTITELNGCTKTLSTFVFPSEEYCTPCATIPNAFTPDGDGRNDLFRVLPGENITVLNLQVYNRWGTLLHDSKRPWNGNYQGKPSPMDVYLFRALVQTRCGLERLSGEVTLLR